MLCLCVRSRHTLLPLPSRFVFFFFNDTATTEIYTLSLHDALPISHQLAKVVSLFFYGMFWQGLMISMVEQLCFHTKLALYRSEEHTSELQSQSNLVCRLLLEKKNRTQHSPCSLPTCTSHSQ